MPDLPCIVQDCPSAATKKRAQVCERHYTRFRRYATFDGRPLTDRCLQCAAPLAGRPAGTLYCDSRCATRYRRKVSEEPRSCLLCATEFAGRSDAIYCSKKCAAKAANLRLNYRLDALDYRAMLDQQRHACPICERRFSEVVPHVDHDHATGRVRGILCSQCNVALGMLHDDEKRARALLGYLHKSNDGQP